MKVTFPALCRNFSFVTLTGNVRWYSNCPTRNKIRFETRRRILVGFFFILFFMSEITDNPIIQCMHTGLPSDIRFLIWMNEWHHSLLGRESLTWLPTAIVAGCSFENGLRESNALPGKLVMLQFKCKSRSIIQITTESVSHWKNIYIFIYVYVLCMLGPWIAKNSFLDVKWASHNDII